MFLLVVMEIAFIAVSWQDVMLVLVAMIICNIMTLNILEQR